LEDQIEPALTTDSERQPREASDAPEFCWKYPEICSYLGGKNTQGPTPLIIFGLPKKNQMVSTPQKDWSVGIISSSRMGKRSDLKPPRSFSGDIVQVKSSF